MTKNAFSSTASNDEAVLSFLRERGILADESITPQQVEEKSARRHVTIRFSFSLTTETFSGRPTVSWKPSPLSSISLCRSSTPF